MEPLGFFGIFKVATRIMRADMKHFFYLTVVFVFPRAVLSVFGYTMQLPSIISFALPTTANTTGSSKHPLLPDGAQFETPNQWALLFMLVKSFGQVVLMLVSIAPLTFSICSGYLNKDLDIKRSLKSTTPKVFRRLLLTYVCIYAVDFVLLIFLLLLAVISSSILYALKINPAFSVGVLVLFEVLGAVGLCYLTVAWSLAFTVSVLEEKWGWEAMRRSAYLVGGRKGVAVRLFVFFSFFGILIAVLIQAFNPISLTWKLVVAVASLVLYLCLAILYNIATTVVFYMSLTVETLSAARQRQEEFKYMDLNASVSPETLDF